MSPLILQSSPTDRCHKSILHPTAVRPDMARPFRFGAAVIVLVTIACGPGAAYSACGESGCTAECAGFASDGCSSIGTESACGAGTCGTVCDDSTCCPPGKMARFWSLLGVCDICTNDAMGMASTGSGGLLAGQDFGHHFRLNGCRGGCGLLLGHRGGRLGAGTMDAPTYTFCGMPSPSYPVPYATPSHVGYTYYTYPPMMPHHSLPHYRPTYSFRHAPGLARTTVHWRTTPVINTAKRLHHIFELPR